MGKNYLVESLTSYMGKLDEGCHKEEQELEEARNIENEEVNRKNESVLKEDNEQDAYTSSILEASNTRWESWKNNAIAQINSLSENIEKEYIEMEADGLTYGEMLDIKFAVNCISEVRKALINKLKNPLDIYYKRIKSRKN